MPAEFHEDIALNALAARREGIVRLRFAAKDSPADAEVDANKQRWRLLP